MTQSHTQNGSELAKSQADPEQDQPPCSLQKSMEASGSTRSSDSQDDFICSIKSLIQSDPHIRNLYLKENQLRLKKNFLKNNQVNSRMRTRLVKWLRSLSKSLEFKTETFFMAVTLLDNYLSVEIQTSQQLQLVGSTCLYISSKLCETHLKSPEVYAYSSAGVFSSHDLLKKERNILTRLNFKTDFPDVMRFLKLLKTREQLTEGQYRECLNVLTFLSENDDYYYEYSSLQLTQLVIRVVKTSYKQLNQEMTYEFLDNQFRKYIFLYS